MENTPNNQRPRREEGNMAQWIWTTVILSAILGSFLIDEKGKITLLAWIGGTAYLITIIFVFFRLQYQEKQFDAQAEKEIDDRFHSAVSLLGNSQTSVRTGAIYSLYHLASKSEKYRIQVAEIMCAHICSTTDDKTYQEKHADRPSNEIQTAINLLFRNTEGAEGLHSKFSLPPANLAYAYLAGANFWAARCQAAIFLEAKCQKAGFEYAHCQGANFSGAQCQGAQFYDAHCEGATFYKAQCQEARFSNSRCQRAFFRRLQCQNAFFLETRCQGADFDTAQCQEANFNTAQCQGADFSRAQCQRAKFDGTQFQGAKANRAHFQGAKFKDAQFQGSHALSKYSYFSLSDRIGKGTELETVVFAGDVSEEAIAAIEQAREFFHAYWYETMRRVIKENNNVKAVYDPPDGVVTGVLEDSPELQQIIKEIGGDV